MAEQNTQIVPFFRTVAEHDPAASKREGRPIYRDVEIVEVRIAGDRNFAPVFHAHQMWKRVDGVEYTYAERWPEQYRRFKDDLVQTAEGTPLEELPFLTNAKRSELRALKIYTAEALAGLEGRNLKTLGLGGTELKLQAQTYLQNARGSADVVGLAAQIAALQQQIEDMRAAGMGIPPAPPAYSEPPAFGPVADGYEDLDDETLKVMIADIAGARPRGNPSHDTLVRTLRELRSSEAGAANEAA
ncbi:hypothetical protein FHS55_002635 [Angulomicrobium tetraedrale]|uniref:Uncharacterized protein n=1 Tax=Ancylobacter tetraedralis TaxID=217068 RepID=A0A839ZBE5_9HYPH|nr:hypothetical protein [Ancylobacter tetraedralis]MBB3772026.1 hypothetical protein [Ancylobacter tetraedralis]